MYGIIPIVRRFDSPTAVGAAYCYLGLVPPFCDLGLGGAYCDLGLGCFVRLGLDFYIKGATVTLGLGAAYYRTVGL